MEVYHHDKFHRFNGEWNSNNIVDLGLHCSRSLRLNSDYALEISDEDIQSISLPDQGNWEQLPAFIEITAKFGMSRLQATELYRTFDLSSRHSKSEDCRNFLLNAFNINAICYVDAKDGYGDNCICILDPKLIQNVHPIRDVVQSSSYRHFVKYPKL